MQVYAIDIAKQVAIARSQIQSMIQAMFRVDVAGYQPKILYLDVEYAAAGFMAAEDSGRCSCTVTTMQHGHARSCQRVLGSRSAAHSSRMYQLYRQQHSGKSALRSGKKLF